MVWQLIPAGTRFSFSRQNPERTEAYPTLYQNGYAVFYFCRYSRRGLKPVTRYVLLTLTILVPIHSYPVHLHSFYVVKQGTLLLLLLLLLLRYFLSPFCKVFTVIYLNQTMFLRCIALQLFCNYNVCYM